VNDACETLKRNRDQYLLGRATEEIVAVLVGIAEQWRRADFVFRRLALEEGPRTLGFSEATIARGLDDFFEPFSSENLMGWITQELGHRQRLDGLVATPDDARLQQSAMARGPEFLVHIGAGNVPNPTLMSMVQGLLVRSAQFVKCASGASLLPRLFAHSLYEAESKLAACLEVAEWPGGHNALEEALFNQANCVTATGSDATLQAIQHRLPAHVRFLPHGHRLSFGYITRERLTATGTVGLVSSAASDTIAWDQSGCLSPHLFYVERGGVVTPEQFAEQLAQELERCEQTQPRGELSAEESALISSRREMFQLRAAATGQSKLWCSQGSTAWTVVYEDDPEFRVSCLHRFIYVKAVRDLAEVLHHAESVRGSVSTVGLAATDDTVRRLGTDLARWGVSRVCSIGRMQTPPLTWRQDGRPTLGELVAWTNLEL
jgi:hypothetical protein